MQATLGLIEKCMTRGWLNMAQLAEIRDTMIGEATYDLDTIEGKVNTLELKTAALQQSLDDVYSQRNALAVALAKVTLLHGGSAGRGYDDTPEKDWDPEWRNVVYVDVPGVGQVSWHMGPKDLPRIESLPKYMGTWDGTAYGRDVSWPDNIDAPQPQPQAEPVAWQLRNRLSDGRWSGWSTFANESQAQLYAKSWRDGGVEVELRAPHEAPQPQASADVPQENPKGDVYTRVRELEKRQAQLVEALREALAGLEAYTGEATRLTQERIRKALAAAGVGNE